MVLKLFKGDTEIERGSVIINSHKDARLFSEITGQDSIVVSSLDGETIRTFIGSYPGYEIRDVLETVTIASVLDVLKGMNPETVAYIERNGTPVTVGELIEQMTPGPTPVPGPEPLTIVGLVNILMKFDPNLPVVGVFPDRPYQQLTAENIALYEGAFETFEDGHPMQVVRMHVKIKPR